MTNEEFLSEALSSENCPRDFEHTYSCFCEYQKIVLDTLREFVRICNANEIHYQLAYGSVLGAVRDGGQIPWDYDADVIVPFYEKASLLEALNRELSEEYCYYSADVTKDYSPYFIRVVPKGYPHEMLHVDVFYALGIPDTEPSRSNYIKELKNRYNARKYVMQDLSKNPHSFKGKLRRNTYKLFYLLKYGKKCTADLDTLFERYNICETKDAVIACVELGKYIYQSQAFLKSIKIETREGVFCIQADYGDYLERRYGDWKKYSPIESRIAEVMKHCKQFKWYRDHKMIPSDAPEI